MISTSYGSAGLSTISLTQQRQQLFDKLDANADGGLDETEFLNGAKAGDSSTSTAKESVAKQLFSSFDGDGDGKLTQDELETGFQKLSDQMRATLIEQQETSRPNRPSPEEFFAKLDANSDGGIDESEFIDGAPKNGRGPSEAELKEKFAAFDTDGDGSLTAEELDTGFKNSRPSGPPPGGPQGGPPPGGGAGGPGGPQGGAPGGASAAADSDDDDDDTLLEMLEKLAQGSASSSVNKEDLASVLESFLKLQEGQVSQSYSATA